MAVVIRGPTFRSIRPRLVQQPSIIANRLALAAVVVVAPFLAVNLDQPIRQRVVQQPQVIDNRLPRIVIAVASPFTGSALYSPQRKTPFQHDAGSKSLALTAIVSGTPFVPTLQINPVRQYARQNEVWQSSVALLSALVSDPFKQVDWPNPLSIRYRSTHDDYLSNHYQIDYPAVEAVQPPQSGGGNFRPYRYLHVSQDFEKKKQFTTDEEEELKRLLLESEEKHRKQIAILEERSSDLQRNGVALSIIRTEIESLQSDLDIRTGIDFDAQIRLMEIKRKRIMTILLLMSAA